MRTVFTVCLFLSALTIFGQAPAAYDSVLAKKLGADAHGMKRYVMVILKTGPRDSLIKGPRRDSLFAGHMKNIGRLADEGLLAVAGPFSKNTQKYRGIFIMNVKTVEEARKLCDTDPTIKEGIFVLDVIEWYGS